MLLNGCRAVDSSSSSAIPKLLGEHSVAQGVDPARTAHHGWDPVDTAIAAGAIELLIVARPSETDGVSKRMYTLKTLKGEPGELLVTRLGVGLGIAPSDGLRLECRIGRFGDHAIERRLIERIQGKLIEQHAIEHEYAQDGS